MSDPVKFVGVGHAQQNNGVPREIPLAHFPNYHPLNTSASLTINNSPWINSPAQAGKVFLTTQGKRFILEASQTRVIYIVNNPGSKDHNKVFLQNPKGFINDVVTYPHERTGRGASAIRKIMETEVQVVIGILSTPGGEAFFTVTGVHPAEFSLTYHDNLLRWRELLITCLKIRDDLKRYAPTLYTNLIYALLFSTWEGTKFIIPQADDMAEAMAEAARNDPKILSRGMGIMVGKLGINTLNTRVAALAGCWTILLNSTTNWLLQNPVMGDTIFIAKRIKDALFKSGVEISMDTGKHILQEVQTYPAELKLPLERLKQIFSAKLPA